MKLDKREVLANLSFVLLTASAVLMTATREFVPNAFAQAVVFSKSENASYPYNVLKHPTGLVMLANGNLYISDTGHNRILSYTPSNASLTTYAGNGTAGYVNSATPTSAEFHAPTGLSGVFTNFVNPNPPPTYLPRVLLWVNDSQNYVVRLICVGAGTTCPSGKGGVTTYAGNHTKGYVNSTNAGSEFASLGGIQYISSNGAATVYIGDSQNHVLRFSNGSTVTTYAGTGTWGLVNGAKGSAQFNGPTKVAFDSSGNMYVADAGNNVIRKITTAGTVTTFAGNGNRGYVNGAPSSAEFAWPCSIVFNPADKYLYVADTMNTAIRRIDLSGNVTTYAGTNHAGLVNGSLSQARFSSPMDLVINNGYMYVSDSTNNAIRLINMSTGAVSTYIH